jgi:hypothetical protein
MLRDAGEIIADAGAWLADAGARGDGGAQAQPSAVEARCDKVYERTVVARSQGAVVSTTTLTRWYAEIATDTDGVIGVDALKCGHETYGVYAETTACAEGATCSGSSMAPQLDCQASSFAEVGPGLIRVDCGYRQRTDYASASNADSDNGDLYKTVRVAVRR